MAAIGYHLAATFPEPNKAHHQINHLKPEISKGQRPPCHRFAGGNTRMKDFDDLYRIANANQKVDAKLIQKLANDRDIELSLDPKWINKQMKEAWAEYTQKKVYKDASDLPKDLSQLIDTTNEYLSNVTNLAK